MNKMAIGDVWESIPQEPLMAMWIQCLIESNKCMSEVVEALKVIPSSGAQAARSVHAATDQAGNQTRQV